MTRPLFVPVLSLGVLATAVSADDVLDRIEAAGVAYEEGKIHQALDNLEAAQQMMREIQAADLSAFLPAPPDGWTRATDSDMGDALSALGGGVGSQATYSGGNEQFIVTLMADNAMVQALAGMLSNAGLMALASQIEIGTAQFMEQDGELTGLVDGRILVQASGAPVETMVPTLARIDYEALADFGR